jgi:hypothetical protein
MAFLAQSYTCPFSEQKREEERLQQSIQSVTISFTLTAPGCKKSVPDTYITELTEKMERPSFDALNARYGTHRWYEKCTVHSSREGPEVSYTFDGIQLGFTDRAQSGQKMFLLRQQIKTEFERNWYAAIENTPPPS